jgi:hypothetical protein
MAGDNDSFPAFSARLRNLLLLEKFKPLGITKYDAKQAPLTWLELLGKNSIDKWDQLKDQFISNFAGAMGCSGTHMDLAMVKQEQGETIRKYMRRFFDKRATIVDVTNKEVIDLFQEGRYHHCNFEDFGHRRPSSITKLKDMITSWADEEDKANTKYNAIHGKIKTTRTASTTTIGIKGVTPTTTTRVLTASASQTTQSQLSSALRKTTRRRPPPASKTC